VIEERDEMKFLGAIPLITAAPLLPQPADADDAAKVAG